MESDKRNNPARSSSIRHRQAMNPDFLSGLLELVNDLVWSISLPEKRLLYINQAAAPIYGREYSEFTEVPDLWFTAIHPEDQLRLDENFENISDLNCFAQQFRIVKRDGSLSWLQGDFQLIAAGDGLHRVGCIAKDVTKRVTTEMALEEAKAIYHSLVESLPINVFRKDREGRIVFGNQRYCDSLGQSLEELINKTDNDLFSAELAEKYKNDDRWVLQTGLPFHDIEEHPAPDGKKIFVEVLKAPVTDSAGRRVGIQGMFWDVSTRKRAEQALREAKEMAEAANQAKSDFLANVSHEIRTPMNAILGMSELLLDTPVEPTQREYLGMIIQSGESLLALINDILDFSKIEAGKLEMTAQSFDIRDAFGDTLRSLALRAHDKSLELAARFDPRLPPRLIGDISRLRQILINLTSNAIKFTHQGEVVVDVSLETFTESDVTLRISVRDTGIGIPENKIDKVFAKFEQADSSTTRQYGGTGLGLAISSRLAELMGGSMSVTSRPGAGSEFSFVMKLPVDRTFEEHPPAYDVADVPVLVVDDNATNRRILEDLLHSWGMRPISASSAEHAIQLLTAMAGTENEFRIVLSDVHMPDQDGYQLARYIRSRPEWNETEIILLTSGGRQGEGPLRRKLRIHTQIFKPVKPMDLLDAIATALGMQPDAATETESVDKVPLGSLRLLLAEDNRVNQKLAVALLEKEGHMVEVTANGREAVGAFEEGRFDAILMDVQMPEMDGLAATQAIRDRETEKRIPIIAMTAHAMAGDRERCLAAGMDEYVSKPIRIQKLRAALEACIGEADRVRGHTEELRVSSKLVSWDHALETVAGDESLLMELVQVYLDEDTKMRHEIDSAILENDARELRRSAHALKGALNHLGALSVASAVYRLESFGESGELSNARHVFDQLQPLLNQLTKELRSFTNGLG